MRSPLALAALVAALVGCGAGDDDEEREYPDEAVASFVAECSRQPNATESACRCVIERLQVTMPYGEFARADEALREDRTPDEAALEKLQTAAAGCLGS